MMIKWQRFRHSSKTGQIATLFVLLMATIFLFTVITINIGKVVRLKTTLDRASDASAFLFSSSLGSFANYLANTYLGGNDSMRTRVDVIYLIVKTIMSIVAIAFGGPLGIAAGTLNIGDVAVHYIYEVAAIVEALNNQFRGMGANYQVKESVELDAFLRVVDDSATVIDAHDVDQDEQTDDKVARFGVWFSNKIRLLKIRQQIIQDFVGMTVDDDAPFMNFYDGVYSFRDYLTNTNPGIPDLVEQINGYVARDINGKLIDLFSNLTFYQSGENNDLLDWLSNSTEHFIEYALNIVMYIDDPATITSFPTWFPLLYNPETYEDWYDVIGDNPADPNVPGWAEGLSQTIVPQLQTVRNRVSFYMNYPWQIPQEFVDQGVNLELLVQLAVRLDEAIAEFSGLHSAIANFRAELDDFWPEASYLLNTASDGPAIYSWPDRDGNWHHVRVEISNFQVPGISVENSNTFWGRLGMQQDYHLENSVGDIWIKITRYDPDTPIIFAGHEFWNFRKRRRVEQQVYDSFSTSEDTNGDGIVTYEDLSDEDRGRVENFLYYYGISSSADAHYDYRVFPNLVAVDTR